MIRVIRQKKIVWNRDSIILLFLKNQSMICVIICLRDSLWLVKNNNAEFVNKIKKR